MDCLPCGCGDLVCLLVIAIIILSIMQESCSVLFQVEEGIANRNNLLIHRAGHWSCFIQKGHENEIGVARIYSEEIMDFGCVEAQKLKPGSEHAVHIFELVTLSIVMTGRFLTLSMSGPMAAQVSRLTTGQEISAISPRTHSGMQWPT